MFETVSPESVGIPSEKVLNFFKSYEANNLAPHSIIMARGNNIFAEAYFKPFHKDFQHRMYSVSKSFVSVAVGLCVEDGLLSLSDKAADYFKEYITCDGKNELQINGVTYILDENPMGIEYVRFDFSGKKGTMSYKNKQGEKKIHFGMGYNEFGKFPQEGYSDMIGTFEAKGNMYDCAASAQWCEEKKLKIKVQIIDKYFGNLCMMFGFKGDKVGISMFKNAEAFLNEYQGYANGIRNDG